MKTYFVLFNILVSSILNAQTMNNQKMTTQIESRNAKLFTTLFPKNNSETVILLHGGPGVPDDMTSAAEILSGQYQVISFHQRGTAKSPVTNSDYAIESYLADIDSVARYFQLEKFHLFGHSWGGLYAQIYAEKNPERILSLFLSSPGSGTGYQWKKTEREVMAFNKSKLSFANWLSLGWNSLRGMMGSDKAYQHVFRQVLQNYNKGFEITGTGSIDLKNVKAKPINLTRKELNKYPMLKQQANPDFKITITYGDRDIYGSSKEYLSERYPTAQIVTIENCGHLPLLHNKSNFLSIMDGHFSLKRTRVDEILEILSSYPIH